jgi:hypothetical protein
MNCNDGSGESFAVQRNAVQIAAASVEIAEPHFSPLRLQSHPASE